MVHNDRAMEEQELETTVHRAFSQEAVRNGRCVVVVAAAVPPPPPSPPSPPPPSPSPPL